MHLLGSVQSLWLVQLFKIICQVHEQVTIEYVPEKAELVDGMDDEFRKIFEKFTFNDTAGSEVNVWTFNLTSSFFGQNV